MVPDKKIESDIKEFTLPGTQDADERILNAALDTFEQAGSTGTTSRSHKLATKAVAAVIAIAVLISLGYGASRIVRRLVVNPAGKAELTIDFKLNKNLHADLRVGTKESPEIVQTSNVRFFVEDGQLRGTLRSHLCYSWPKFKWRSRIVLLDDAGRRLASAQHVSENSGIKGENWNSWFDHCVHFTLGSWEGDLPAQVKKVSIQFEQVPERTKTTPNAWLGSDVLPVLHGRVTRPDGRPIAWAVVQIREERKEGQKGIAAPEVWTDRQGFYCFDDIRWAYHVGVLAYTYKPSGDGYRHEYKHLNKTLHGTNKVAFVLEEPLSSTGVIKGQMLAPDSEAIEEFKLDVRNRIDWKDRSGEYLYQFGIKEYVSDPEGRFEVSGLPAGKYSVALWPTIRKATGRTTDFVDRREYICELAEGQTIDIAEATEKEKAWYGRVLFDDGTPAVLPGAKTEIAQWSEPYGGMVWTVARVDEEGYFTAFFSDDVVQLLKSEEVWLTTYIGKKSRSVSRRFQGEKLPFSLLSMDKEKAGTLKISRPAFYHGRIFYESGKPAVPPTAPWRGAGIYIQLYYKPPTAGNKSISEDLGGLDENGYFSIILTDEQLRKLQAREYSLEILHPVYEEERVSTKIGKFPPELLSGSRDAVKGYILPPESLTTKYRNIAECLDSYEMLETLGSLLEQWRGDHKGEFPMNLSQLHSYARVEMLSRITENIEYQPGTTTGNEAEASLIAYDKRLLEKIKGTHVLFSDGKIEFLRQRKLGTIDIHK